MLKKAIRIFGVVAVTLLIILTVTYLILNEPLPVGTQSNKADSLANRMLTAINHEAYKNTRFLKWTFGGRRYTWDKQEHVVNIGWEKYEVELHLKVPDESNVKVSGKRIDQEAQQTILQDAIFRFNNDSFWLVAPNKVFDPGTKRRLVTLENGREALLVTYTSGGSTPGDSYLWIIDEFGKPEAWKMWVSILPIGGIKSTWESWKTTESGALLATKRTIFSFELTIENVKGWNTP